MNQIYYFQVAPWQQFAYSGVLLLSFLYLVCLKYQGKWNFLFIIFLFFAGLFQDISELLFGNRLVVNAYQIGMLAWSLFLLPRTNFEEICSRHKITTILFVLYGVYFIFNSILHHDDLLIVISQYSKVFIPICFLFVLAKMIEEDYHEKLFWLFWELVIFQIFFSVFKLVLLGGFIEGWVGSLSAIRGGACGTTLPLLGLFLFALKNDMKIRDKYSLLYLIGLLIVGFAAGKRAVWLLFPILYFILSFYVYRHSLSNKLVVGILVLPVVVYAALRLSPTLNPDNKVGGRFDPEYTYNYVMKYSAGIDETHKETQQGVGRLGAVSWMNNRVASNDHISLFGKGVEYIAVADHDDYSNKKYYQGIKSRGSITGIVSTFMMQGIIGVILFVSFLVSLFLQNRSRFGLVLMSTILFDYIFYNASMVNVMALFTLALFLCLYPTESTEAEFDIQ